MVAILLQKSCLSDESYGKTIPQNEKRTFSPSAYTSFEYNAQKIGTVVTEQFIGDFLKNTFQLTKNKTAMVSLPFKKAYKEAVSINPKKIANLRQVEGSILEEHRQFYQEIFNWSSEQDDRTELYVESDGEYDYVP